MKLTTSAAVILAIAVLAAGTYAHGHGISIRVHESQEVVALAVTAGCAAGMSQELSRQPLAGVATGVEFVQTSSMAVCVQRVDADKRVIEVRDANDKVFTLSVADAEPPLDSIAAGDTITLTVRRALTLRRLSAPPVEEPPPQPGTCEGGANSCSRLDPQSPQKGDQKPGTANSRTQRTAMPGK